MPVFSVEIPARDARLNGDAGIPTVPRGVVIFAHGSGSGRFSPRNRAVAAFLQRERFATVLMDLLTQEEERIDQATGSLRFDIPLLAARVVATVDWATADAAFESLPIGLFGASTGAAAAQIAAAQRSDLVRAIVSRGGRPDLAGDALADVVAPTLLIVGGRDEQVIRLNEMALARLTCTKRLDIVRGATHLFEEPGALEHVSRLAADWFGQYLVGGKAHG